MLGNIKFIGELGKLDMLHEGILHQCIKQLLGKSKRIAVADVGEDLECLCHMMRTVGRRLDHDKARSWVDQYFERMRAIMNQTGGAARIKFMLQDIIELRKNNWVPRRIRRENGPKTIQQVHQDAAREMGIYIPPSSSPNCMPFPPGGGDLFGARAVNGYSGPGRGPMSDMFGPLQSSPPVMGGIGTGPGVIPMDPFGSGFLDAHRGGRGRGFPHQFGNRRGAIAGADNKYNASRDNKPSYAKSDRERHHDDDDEDERPGSGGSGGSGYGSSDSRGRGVSAPYRGNRGFNNSRGGHDAPGTGYAPRGALNSVRGQPYNRSPNFQPRANFNPDGPNRTYQDQDFQPLERNFDRDQPAFNHGGFNRDSGFQPDGYNRGGYRGGFEPRGAFNSRGGFDHLRGGFDHGRGGFDHGRGGFDHGRGGFDHSRGGFDHGPPFNQQQNMQKDLDKLPPRFRKQLEMQQGAAPLQNGAALDAPPVAMETRGPPPHVAGPLGSGGAPVSGLPAHLVERVPLPPTERQSFFGPPPPQIQMAPVIRTPSPPVCDSPPPAPGPPPPSFQARSPSKLEEISLRPVRMPTFRPNMPSMLPKSAQGPATTQHRPVNTTAPQPTFEDMIPPAQKATIMGAPQPSSRVIKTLPSQEKIKEQRKTPSRDELKQNTDILLSDYLETRDLEQALTALRALKAPTSYMPELVTYLIVRSLDNSDTDRDAVSELITATKQDGLLDSRIFMQGFEAVLDQMKSLESDVPLVKSYVSKFAAHALGGQVTSLTEVSRPLQQGRHYPLFLLCLQQIHKIKDKEWLVKAFNESKLDLQNMLPECDQSKERMLEVMDDRGLSFMFPLLRVQSDLRKQMQHDPSASRLYKWIKDNYSQSVLHDPGFIRILFPTVLGAVTEGSTLAEGIDTDQEPQKGLAKREKELMDKYKLVLAAFIHESMQLQIESIYAVQVFCHKNNFPKGMLLRMFMHLYDLEIVEEDAFLRWKEDLNEEFPGKGKALFQVNQWLIWLEIAESESSDED